MEQHENNGHGNSHDDHATEGNHQYYPKGWWIPLIGLLIVAFGFTCLGTFVFSHSGTDRWGKTEQCDNNTKCCNDPNCKGDKCKEGKEGMECKDGKDCKDKAACDKDASMSMGSGQGKDSAAMKAEDKPEGK